MERSSNIVIIQIENSQFYELEPEISWIERVSGNQTGGTTISYRCFSMLTRRRMLRTINDLKNEPKHKWRLPGVSKVTKDDNWHHDTALRLISRIQCSQHIPDSVRNVNLRPHVHSKFEPGVNTVGIYIEKRYSQNRECFNWILFEFWNKDFRWLFPDSWQNSHETSAQNEETNILWK